jgi:hypothetical protein
VADHPDAKIADVEFCEVCWQYVCRGCAASELMTGERDVTRRQEIGVESACIEREIVAGGYVDGDGCVRVRLRPDVGAVEAMFCVGNLASREEGASVDSEVVGGGPEADQADAGAVPFIVLFESSIDVVSKVGDLTVVKLAFGALAVVSREKMLFQGSRHFRPHNKKE